MTVCSREHTTCGRAYQKSTQNAAYKGKRAGDVGREEKEEDDVKSKKCATRFRIVDIFRANSFPL